MSEAFGLKSIASHLTDATAGLFKQRLALACSLDARTGYFIPLMNQRPGLILTRREFWPHINSMVVRHGNGDAPTLADEAEYCDVSTGLVAEAYRQRYAGRSSKRRPPMSNRPIRRWSRLITLITLFGIRSIRMISLLSRAACVVRQRDAPDVRDPSSWLDCGGDPAAVAVYFVMVLTSTQQAAGGDSALNNKSREALDFTTR